MGEVVKLPTLAEKGRQDIDELMASLNEQHAAGKIISLCAVRVDEKGESFTVVSNSMTIATFSYAIHCLQERLFRWVGDK